MILGRTFTLLYGAGGVLALATLLFPHDAGLSPLGIVSPALAALGLAAFTTLRYERISPTVYRWYPTFGAVLVTIVVVSADAASMMPYASFYFWVILSAFYLFDGLWAWLNVSFVGIALALALHQAPQLHDRTIGWVMLMGALSVSGAVTGLLRTRLEGMVGESQTALAHALDSEQALAEAQRIAGVGSWEVDLATRRFDGSAQLLRMLGLEPGTIGSIDQVVETLAPDEQVRIRELFRDAIKRGGGVDLEHAVALPNGEQRVLHTRGRVVHGDDGSIRLVGTTQDITERRAQDERLQRTLRRLRATIDIALALGREPDPAGLLQLISQRAQSLLEAQAVYVLLGEKPDARPVAVAGELNGLATEAAVARALRAPLSYRGVTHGVLVALPSPDDGGFTSDDEEMLRTFASSAATAVAGAKTVQEDALRHSIEASERERQRIARELHDQTLQSLGVLRLGLEAGLAKGPEALQQTTDYALGLIVEEVENLRRIIADLRPALLDDLGLRPALEAIAERVRSDYELDIATQIDLEEERLPSETERTVYRVVQECLTNICRHAGATEAVVLVRATEDEVLVRVSDDGHGFTPGTSEGFGLAGMRERLSLLGGTLAIESGRGGTCVEATLPFEPDGYEPAN